jgi:hypothetical protein
VRQPAAIQKKELLMKKVAVVRNFATVVFLLALSMALPAARADEGNQATEVTFNQPVQIPGRVLPAGTYWFVLPENATEHDQVRIYNSDRTILYATLLTANAERLQPTENAAFIFTERRSGQPQAIVSWFYPGRLNGHEFLYSARAQKELAKNKQVSVVAGK